MSEPLRVLIADDEPLARARLTRLLGALTGIELAGECTDGSEMLKRIEKNDVDVVLLDMQMPGLSGLEALSLWPKDGPLVIFCTAHDNHAVKAFDEGAIDYVLKPVELARLKKALERARTHGQRRRFQAHVEQHQSAARLPVSTRQGVVLLDSARITHAVLSEELVTVFTLDGTHLTDYSLQELLERLPAGRFERVHRNALLCLEHVSRLEPLETGGYLAHTAKGQSVEISRQSARNLRKRLGLRKSPGDD
jgi:two-component system LytT family response regulator